LSGIAARLRGLRTGWIDLVTWLRTRVLPLPRRGLLYLAARWYAFVAWFNGRRLDENTILLVFAVAVGVAGALGVVIFFKAIDLFFLLLYRLPAAHLGGFDHPYYRPILTAAGFAAAAWVARRFAQGEDGPNVPYVQLAVARRGGNVPTGAGVAHAAASALTLGSGGSAGSEGPTAVLGATFGSALARAFRFTPEESLLEAMRRMGVRGSGSLPVVDGAGHLRGLVTRAHIMAVYVRRLAGVPGPPGGPRAGTPDPGPLVPPAH